MNNGFNVRFEKMLSPSIYNTYNKPKKAITDQLTKKLKKLPGVCPKTYLPK